MRAKLSVIIPTLNAADQLERCLPALMEGLHIGLIREVIVSDAGSTDPTTVIADRSGALVITGAPSRGGQLRRGAGAAQGDWLLFLHADTVLPVAWTECVMTQMTQGAPAAFRLRYDARGLMPRLVAGWANLRSRVFGLPYGDQALLVSRADYDAAGGYADVPLMEDVALVRALPKVRIMRGFAVTSADKYQTQGWIKRGARNLATLLRYLAGADPAELAKRY